MDFSRINRTHIAIVGSVVILLSCGLIYGLFIRNVQTTLSVATAYQAGMEKDAGDQALKAAQTATTQSFQNMLVGETLHQNFELRNPTFRVDTTNGGSMWAAQSAQELEVMQNITPMMQRAFNRRLPDLSVTSKWTFAPPPLLPMDTFKVSPITFMNCGTITMRGTYAAIERYFVQISTSLPRICTFGAVSLDATNASNAYSRAATGMVNGTFQVSLYEFVPGVPEAPSGGAAGGAAGPGGGAPPGGGPVPSGPPPSSSPPPAKT